MTYGKVKYGKMLERKISWEVLKIFIEEGSSDDLGFTFIFYGEVKFAFLDFMWKEIMNFVDFDP